jgi:hypothetical protein
MDRESFLKDLSKMNDLDALIYVGKAVVGEARSAVQERILAVLPSILPQIKDFKILSYYWHKVYSKAQTLIEKRMAEILSQTNDLKILRDYFGVTLSGSKPEGLVMKKIKEISDVK